ncbi:DUF2867 domain-containing protein [Ideonella azotifigens]|uniref:DUF2867 domain-containing protein n=1 Tax=Ideonella azotifigens TaxID=513160 RepID=A0ABN1KH57_9BURK|nr:DUF2867 domain-containing protein [Ideonella azotifigens]MCD2344929.1 DUF2867 domain-containing protein [Ideonella azotifigens]
MSPLSTTVSPVPVPTDSRIGSFYANPYLADAFAVALPANVVRDPELLARFVFGHQPGWINQLMGVRDAMVSVFGLKTAKALSTAGPSPATNRVGLFKIYERHASEIILGENDKHLDFRASVMCRPAAAGEPGPTLVMSTVVCCHNRLGRSYIGLIRPFHRLVVQASLRRAAQVGFPTEATG